MVPTQNQNPSSTPLTQNQNPSPRGLTQNQKILLIIGFLFTGSINTLTKKFQFDTCSKSIDVGHSNDDGKCPTGEKKFDKPWSQNICMFMGEALVLSLFCYRRPARMEARSLGNGPTAVPFYVFLAPAACDVLGTGIGGVGMMYINAAVWQMMRGSLIIFTAILTRTALRKQLDAYKWVAVLVSATGLALVGTAAILDSGNSQKNVPLGIFFTILSQFFAACQMVVEEFFVKSYQAPPEQCVGSEGVWGIGIMTIVLTVMYFIPGGDAGSYENVGDSVYMLFHSGTIMGFMITYLVSISFFNFFGVTISGQVSAQHRTITDALRTSIVWVVQLVLYYSGATLYGTKWEKHSWVELIGFIFLMLGSFINSAVIKVPGLKYDDNATPSTEEGDPSHGTSLQAGETGKSTA